LENNIRELDVLIAPGTTNVTGTLGGDGVVHAQLHQQKECKRQNALCG